MDTVSYASIALWSIGSRFFIGEAIIKRMFFISPTSKYAVNVKIQ